ncbi:MAG: hypothetical protein RL199_1786 [Pseudomonadota bacterium]|jgi:hypothetical protein
MKKKSPVVAGIVPLEKLVGGATLVALALGATACGGTASTASTASTDSFAASEEALSGANSTNVTLPVKWVKAKGTAGTKFKVTVKKPDAVAGKAIKACVGFSSFASETTDTAWTCAAGSTSLTFAAGDASKATGDLVLPDTATKGLNSVHVKFSNEGSTKFASTESASIVFDPDAPVVSASVVAIDRGVKVTLPRPPSDKGGSGIKGGVRVTQSKAAGTPVITKDPLACTQKNNELTCLGLTNGTAYKIGVWATDNVGNVGSYVSPSVTPSVTTKPTVNSFVVAGGSPVVKDAKAIWVLKATGASDAKIASFNFAKNDADFPADYTNIAKPGSPLTLASDGKKTDPSGPITLVEGENVVKVKVRDNQATPNVSEEFESNTVFLDTQAPSIALSDFAATPAGIGLFTFTVKATVTNTEKNEYASDIASVVVAYSPGAKAPTAAPKAGSANLLTCESDDDVWTCKSGLVAAGDFSVFAEVKDQAGNAGTTKLDATNKKTVAADTTAPVLEGDVEAEFEDDEANAGMKKATLEFSKNEDDSDLLGYVVTYAAGSKAPENCDSGEDGGTFGPEEDVVVSKLDGQEFSFRVCAVDLAGNVGGGVKYEPPAGPPYAVFLVPGAFWINVQKVVPDETFSLSDAVAYCEGLELGGFTDWSVPNPYFMTNGPQATRAPFVDASNRKFWGLSEGSGLVFDSATGEYTSPADDSAAHYVRCFRIATP